MDHVGLAWDFNPMKTAKLAPLVFRRLIKTNNASQPTPKRQSVSLRLQAERLSGLAGNRTRNIDQAFQSMRLNLRFKSDI